MRAEAGAGESKGRSLTRMKQKRQENEEDFHNDNIPFEKKPSYFALSYEIFLFPVWLNLEWFKSNAIFF